MTPYAVDPGRSAFASQGRPAYALPEPSIADHAPAARSSRSRGLVVAGTFLLAAAVIAPAASMVMQGGPGDGGSALNPSGGRLGLASSSASAPATLGSRRSPAPSRTSSPAPSRTPGSTSPAGPITSATTLSPLSGSVVFVDAFGDPSSGWMTSSGDAPNTYGQYQSGGYVIVSMGGSMEHLVYSPYRAGRQQLSMSLTATETGAPAGAGFGVTCRRGTGDAAISYTFIVLNTGRFVVERVDGEPSLDKRGVVLQHGNSPVPPGWKPITVVGICATLADGVTTRLAFFVAGHKLADLTNAAVLGDTGWTGGIDMASGASESIVTAISWVERDLTR